LALAAVVWIRPGRVAFLLPIMIVAAITDVLDGWFARRARLPSSSPGRWLDPLCDKTFVVSVLASVWFAHRSPLWLLALVASRELIQGPVLAIYHLVPGLRDRIRFDVRAAAIGKVATVAQFLAVGAIVLRHPWQMPLAVGAGLVGTAAAVYYIRRALSHASRGGLGSRTRSRR
jgi:phosphatidylglycerophosphate synthase